jgi:hypothetical protein
MATAPPAAALISLTAGPTASLSPFGVGQTATGSSFLTATDPSGTWTLQAQDQGAGAGQMVASPTGCTNSSTPLTNPLQVSVSNAPSGVSTSAINLSAANQTVASATSTPLTAATLTTNYTQVIAANQVLLTGCVYTITVTYSLQ